MKLKQTLSALADWLTPTVNMANEGEGPKPLDYKKILLTLLGLGDDSDDSAINARYEEAMGANPDEDAEKVKTAEADKMKMEEEKNKLDEEKKTMEANCAAKDKLLGNEKARADKAEADLKTAKQTIGTLQTSIANERTERVKLLLDEKVRAGFITGAERKQFEAEFANAEAFDATLSKLGEKQGTKLPANRQAGMANIGKRQPDYSPEAAKRQEAIQNFVNEEMAKPIYKNIAADVRYSRAFTSVLKAHPELTAAK